MGSGRECVLSNQNYNKNYQQIPILYLLCLRDHIPLDIGSYVSYVHHLRHIWNGIGLYKLGSTHEVVHILEQTENKYANVNSLIIYYAFICSYVSLVTFTIFARKIESGCRHCSRSLCPKCFHILLPARPLRHLSSSR